MRTYSFDQAQSHYDNMMPTEYHDSDYDYYEDEFNEVFFRGQLVLTPDGTGIINEEYEGETTSEWDDGYYEEKHLTKVSVSVPMVGRYMYDVKDIKVRTKSGTWVRA